MMCSHNPPCPPLASSECAQARMVADHMEQGWALLCNGVVVFDDGVAMRPSGDAFALTR